MLKKLISLLEKIKCKFSCCYESQCSVRHHSVQRVMMTTQLKRIKNKEIDIEKDMLKI